MARICLATVTILLASRAMALPKESEGGTAVILEGQIAPEGVCSNDTEIINRLVMDANSGYNKHRIPGRPVNVRVEMWVQEVTSVSEITQDFEIDLYINEFWEDPSLEFNHLRPCKRNMSLDYTILDKLWTPNTCFINSKEAFIHESPFRNIFLMIFPNGTVWTNYRVKLTGPCDMDLKRFPMDVQKCGLTFESYNYNTDEVRMRWLQPTPVIVFKKIELPDFTMVNFSVIAVEQLYPAGWWDELTVTFVFKRRYGWYILQGYIPTYLTIFISWISFYLGVRAVPARTMIGVNALLAMTFQFGNIIRNLPRVSYVKAIDVWMLSGMTFIFASLLELAVIGFMSRNTTETAPSMRNRTRKEIRANRPSPWLELSPIHNNNDDKEFDLGPRDVPSMPRVRYRQMDGRPHPRAKRRRRLCCSAACNCVSCCELSAENIDRLSAVLFPTSFFIFNVCYWGYYLYI